jgi:hypothetical protein
MSLIYARIVADEYFAAADKSQPALHHPLDNITGIRAEPGRHTERELRDSAGRGVGWITGGGGPSSTNR